MRTFTSTNDELDLMANNLSNFLKPVRPSAQYTSKIRDRIHLNSNVELSSSLSDNRKLLYSLGGVLTASLLLLTIARAMYFFFRNEKA